MNDIYNFAISNIAWLPEEREAAYDAMAAAEVHGLEIAPGLLFHSAADALDPSHEHARSVLAEINNRGLKIVSMQSLLFGVTGAELFTDAQARAKFTRGMERAISFAGRFEIPNLVFGSPAQRRVPDDMPMTEALGIFTDIFLSLADKASAAGTKISIEANPEAYGTNFINRIDEAVEVVARLNHPAITCILDLGAMHMNGEYSSIGAKLPELLPVLNHVHVSEPHLQPAPQDISALAPVLNALEDGGYSKAISIEMKRPPDGIAGVQAALNRLRLAAQNVGNHFDT